MCGLICLKHTSIEERKKEGNKEKCRTHTHTHTHMYIYKYICWYVLHVCIHTHTYRHTYKHIYTYTYIFIHIYMHMYIHSHIHTHPQIVFLCLGCRLGDFVPLSGFFHEFVSYFDQSSQTNVDWLWYKRIEFSSSRLVKVTHKSVKEPRKWNKIPQPTTRTQKIALGMNTCVCIHIFICTQIYVYIHMCMYICICMYIL